MNRFRFWLRFAELSLLFAGALCVGYLGIVHVQAASARRSSDAMVQAAASQTALVQPETSVRIDDNAVNGPARVMGKLEIRAIGLSVPIMSDYRSASLLKGIGYIPGTATPGGLGTLGLAGHRDTYFRPLSRIAPKMDIRVGDATGVYHYQVDSTQIVKPEQVSVLDIRNVPELTLITCYPFHYIGAAPFRFIVHAHLLSVVPD